MGNIKRPIQGLIFFVVLPLLVICFLVNALLGNSLFNNIESIQHRDNVQVPVYEPSQSYGRERFEGARPTHDFAVRVDSDHDALELAKSMDMELIGPVGTLPNHYIFRARPDQIEKASSKLEEHPHIAWFEQQAVRWRHPRSVTQEQEDGAPDNTSYTPIDPNFHDQWHLLNTGQLGEPENEDMRVFDAWKITRGRGVCVAIVDDGLMYTHPDLQERYSAQTSHNFNADRDPSDPMPVAGDSHGTMCAGATAATTNNVCGVGVAFEASVAGLRILGGPSSDAMEAHALTYMYHDNHIYSSSWGPTDNGITLEGPGPLTKAALEDGIARGRDGKGSVYIWAAGNGAKYGDNCNYDGYASSRYVLTVGAVNHFGKHAYYSEPCAAMIVSAPSSGQDKVGITTTDLNGGCTKDFTGTSASAPLVAGVAALMLEVNSNLTWRDMHHIMARTARRNDPADIDWVENGAGLWVNHKYGFGVVDAHAAVVAAKNWVNVEKEISFTSPIIEVGAQLPDNTRQAVVSTFHVETDIYLEHVEIGFTAFHPFRADLRVVITSPHNTSSILSTLHGTSSSYEFQVIFPKNMTKTYHVVRAANFGPIPSDWEQQNATAKVVLAEPLNACKSLENEIDLTGLIVIVQRGTCEFAYKVKMAQQRGAAAVLVVPEKDNEPATEMISKDSNGSVIAIPSAMMAGRDGVPLIAKLRSGSPVIGSFVARVNKQNGLIPFNDWTFSTVRNWNESSRGTWTISVSDLSTGGVGTFDRWQLRLHGVQGSPSPPTPKPIPHAHTTISKTRKGTIAAVVITIPVLGLLLGWWLLRKPQPRQCETILLEEVTTEGDDN